MKTKSLKVELSKLDKAEARILSGNYENTDEILAHLIHRRNRLVPVM